MGMSISFESQLFFCCCFFLVEQPLQERQQNCDINNGGCDHWCIPHVHVTKSVLCACREGFNLAADGHTCQGKNKLKNK